MGDAAAPDLRREQLVQRFPGLGRGRFRITSPEDPGYNCMAYAAGETRRCWDPSAFACLYWPTGAHPVSTVEVWVAGYEALGYRVCASADPEEDVEKVAIYALDGQPRHVARQLRNGLWTSKLGPREDIEHELDGPEGDVYGRVDTVLARPFDSQDPSPR